MTIYTETEKQIYTSPLQTKHDPVDVSNRLIINSNGKFNEWLSVWQSTEADAVSRAVAALNIAATGRTVFGFKKLVDDGAGDGVVLEVVAHFMEYVTKKG